MAFTYTASYPSKILFKEARIKMKYVYKKRAKDWNVDSISETI